MVENPIAVGVQLADPVTEGCATGAVITAAGHRVGATACRIAVAGRGPLVVQGEVVVHHLETSFFGEFDLHAVSRGERVLLALVAEAGVHPVALNVFDIQPAFHLGAACPKVGFEAAITINCAV